MKKLIALLVFATITVAGCSDNKETEEPPKSYVVSLADDGHGTATADTEKAEAGRTITLTATPADGYEFAAWIVMRGDVLLADETVNPTTFVMPESDVEIKATFVEPEAETYTVTVTAETGGSVIYDPHVAAAGTTVKMQASPDNGYRFSAWHVEKGGVKIIETANPLQAGFVMGEEEVVILARFEKETYSLTVENSEGGTIKVTVDGSPEDWTSLTPGIFITMEVTGIEEGYTFDGWALDGYELTSETVWKQKVSIAMPAEDLIIKAKFRKALDDMADAIEDPVFRKYVEYRIDHEQTVEIDGQQVVLPKWDTDGDGKISEQEAQAVKTIDISKTALEALPGFDWSGEPIKSVKGVERFGLERFVASGHAIEEIDLSHPGLPLKVLICEADMTKVRYNDRDGESGKPNGGFGELMDDSRGALKKLSVIGCADLVHLDVTANRLTELVVRNNRNLVYLDCEQNMISELDISKNDKLNHLYCYENKISTLNLTTIATDENGRFEYHGGRQWIGNSYDPKPGQWPHGKMTVYIGAKQVGYWNSFLTIDETEKWYNAPCWAYNG